MNLTGRLSFGWVLAAVTLAGAFAVYGAFYPWWHILPGWAVALALYFLLRRLYGRWSDWRYQRRVRREWRAFQARNLAAVFNRNSRR